MFNEQLYVDPEIIKQISDKLEKCTKCGEFLVYWTGNRYKCEYCGSEFNSFSIKINIQIELR